MRSIGKHSIWNGVNLDFHTEVATDALQSAAAGNINTRPYDVTWHKRLHDSCRSDQLMEGG